MHKISALNLRIKNTCYYSKILKLYVDTLKKKKNFANNICP